MDYQKYLYEQLYKTENLQKIYTSDINFRVITGYQNQFKELAIILHYIKENKICNVQTSYQQRLYGNQITPYFNESKQFKSSVVIINKEYQQQVSSICKSSGIDFQELRRQDINKLKQKQGQSESQFQQQLFSFFNSKDLFICPSQLIDDLRRVLQTKESNILNIEELHGFWELIELSKKVDSQQLEIQEFGEHVQQIINNRLQIYKTNSQSREKARIEEISCRCVKYHHGFYFQRVIFYEQESSKCDMLLTAKCQLFIRYSVNSQIQIKKLLKSYNELIQRRKQDICHVIINTQEIQLKQVLIDKQHQFIKHASLFNQTQEIPCKVCCLYKYSDQLSNQVDFQLAKLTPYKIYDYNDEMGIKKCVNRFKQVNEQLPISKQIKDFNHQRLERQFEENKDDICFLCMNYNPVKLLFACCGYSMCQKCVSQCFKTKRQCPQCRFNLIDNYDLTAFLSKIEDKQTNITIIYNNKILKQCQFDQCDIVDIIYQLDNQELDINTLYKYILQIPGNKQINLQIHSIDRHKTQKLLSILEEIN